MAVSRRRFLGSTAAAGAAAAVAPQLSLAQGLAQLANPAPAAAGDPPLAVIALNRMGYGPRPGDIDAFLQLGGTPEARLSAYVDQQLNPDDASDTVCQQKLASVKQRISYQQADGSTFTEDRPLRTLNQSLAELWSLRTSTTQGAEYNRPTDEVRTATWLRAVYSKWQLREVLTEFWHNHFNTILSEVMARRLANGKLGQIFPGITPEIYSATNWLDFLNGADLPIDYTSPTPNPNRAVYLPFVSK